MNRKCPNCQLVNFSRDQLCVRCGAEIHETENTTPKPGFLKTAIVRRAVVCMAVLILALAGFYASLVFSADRVGTDEQRKIDAAIKLLDACGFGEEVFYLKNLAVFRSTDNWLNASVEKENAYAATNFPFEIVTIYPEFFIYPADDTERAAILLHEAQHLKGKNEKDAYQFVWKNKARLGWTGEYYGGSPVWKAVRKQTRDYSPNLFVCDFNEFDDCTE